MKIIYKFLIFVLLFIPAKALFSQQLYETRMKIEVSVKDGKNLIIGALKSYSISYNPTFVATEGAKAFYLSMDFEKCDISLLGAFVQNKSDLDGEITVTDMYGKFPARKIEFQSARMEAMNEQVMGEYNNMSMNVGLTCNLVTIDGLKIEH